MDQENKRRPSEQGQQRKAQNINHRPPVRYDENGNPRLECTCTVRSWNESWTATSSSKKEAKRYSAYLVLCDYFDLDNEYESEDEDDD